MSTLITKSPFYVRAIGEDGEVKQEFVRLGSGAVLRHLGNKWCESMPGQRSGGYLGYVVAVKEGVDDLGNDWSGSRMIATPARFTSALVSSKMTSERDGNLLSEQVW